MLYWRFLRITSLILAALLFFNSGPRQIMEVEMQVGAGHLEVLAAPAAAGQFDDLLRELQTAVTDPNPDLEQILNLKEQIGQANEAVLAYFEQQAAQLAKLDLPAQSVVRMETAVATYQTQYATLLQQLQQIEETQGEQASLTQLAAFLTTTLPVSDNDFRELPWHSLKTDTVQTWTVGLGTEGTSANDKRSTKLVAPAADDPPTANDLEETVEVQFTPEITQLAANLQHNPVNIYNWVYNNITFTPTWGSIQGAAACLENRICNAFDTSSLLIALLRVSDIPARYQLGTIDVPVDMALNWLGNFQDATAAARYLASAGIPSAGTVQQAGNIYALRLEHVWVKAYIDYIPSQGSVQQAGDTWLNMDAAFKQYQYTAGTDFLAATDYDPAAFYDHLQANASLNVAQNAVTHVDTAYIEQTWADVGSELAGIFPDDVAALLPQQTIISTTHPILAGSLPYPVRLFGLSLPEVPDVLRHKLTVSVHDETGELLTYTAVLPAVAQQTLSIAYEPATQSDIDYIQSVVPTSQIVQEPENALALFFTAVSPQLVNVHPMIQLNGVTTVVGSETGMGAAQTVLVQFEAPTIATPAVELDARAWGHIGLTLDLAGISDEHIASRISHYDTLVQDFAAAQANDDINGMGQLLDPLTVDAYDLIVRNWFYRVDHHSRVLSNLQQVAFARYPSLGFFYAGGTVTELFGNPIQMSQDKLYIDIVRQLHIVTALDGDENRERGFSLHAGIMSSRQESDLLAQSIAIDVDEASSAASLLWRAAEQNIPIHTILPGNESASESILALLDNGYPKEAMRDALNAGKVVTVPQNPITIDGESTYGYVVVDPETGDGAYLLGRANGGGLQCKDPSDKTCQFLLDLATVIQAIGIALTMIAFGFFIAFAIEAIVAAIFTAVAKASVIAIIAAVYFGYEKVTEVGGKLFEFLDCVSQSNIACTEGMLEWILGMME
ncbi:MAG: transglutaminase family protein [Chloroflexota bacterium]